MIRKAISSVLVVLSFGFSASATDREKTYRRILDSPPLTFNPGAAVDTSSTHVLYQCAEGLVRYDQNALAPGLAERWEISQDQKVYQFFLRKGVQFSNGKSITSDDVVAMFENAANQKGLPYRDMMVIDGAQDFAEGKTKLISGLKILSPDSLEIHIKEPFAPFLDTLTSPGFLILPRESYGKLEPTNLIPFVGSGPYLLDSVSDSKMVLKKNVHYHSSSSVFFERIEYDVNVTLEKAVSGFLRGDYDDIWPYHVSDIPKETQKSIRELPFLTAQTNYLSVNAKRNSLKDTKIRAAIRHSLTYEKFMKKLALPDHYRAYGFIPRGMLGYNDKLPKDPLWKTAKVANTCKGRCRFQVITFEKQIFEALPHLFDKENLKEIGVAVESVFLDKTEFIKRLASHDYDLAYVPIKTAYRDTFMFLRTITDPRFGPPGIDTTPIQILLDQARTINRKTERGDLYMKSDRLILETEAVIPIYHGDVPVRHVRSDLEGFALPYLNPSFFMIKDVRRTQRIENR